MRVGLVMRCGVKLIVSMRVLGMAVVRLMLTGVVKAMWGIMLAEGYLQCMHLLC